MRFEEFLHIAESVTQIIYVGRINPPTKKLQIELRLPAVTEMDKIDNIKKNLQINVSIDSIYLQLLYER